MGGERLLTKTEMRFPHKAILTAVMLEEMYNYPRELVRLNYRERSDGIICGLDYMLRGNDLILTEGLVKLDGEIYILSDEVNVSALAGANGLTDDGHYYIVLEKASSVRRDVCLTEDRLEIKFVEHATEGFCLGAFVYKDRFKLPELSEGAKKFEHFFEASYFNVTNVLMSSKIIGVPKGGLEMSATFHPLIFRAVEKFLVSKKNKTLMDYAILVALQSVGSVDLKTIKAYVVEEGETLEGGSREELLRTFFDCLMRSKAQMLRAESDSKKDELKPIRRTSPYGKMLS